MNQGVLVHADIGKSAEVRDVGDHAFEDHVGLQIFDAVHAFVESDGAKLTPRVASRLAQFGDDVDDGRDPEAIVDKLCWLEPFAERCVADQRLRGDFEVFGHAVDDRIALRMNGRVVERLVAVGDPQEPGRLLKRFLAQLGNGHQLPATGEATMVVAMLDDLLREPRTDPGDVGQQGDAGHIDVDADMVDARLDHPIQALAELRLIDVVLVLSDADGFRVRLDQFRKRVLQTAGDADCAADRDIEIGELSGRQLAGGINRGTRFADHDLRNVKLVFSNQVTDKRIGFAGGGTVANGDQFHVVLLDHLPQCHARRTGVALGWCRVDRGVGEKLPGSIHDRHFAAGAKTGIDTDRDSWARRCRHQQFPQVLAKHADRFFVRLLFQGLEHRRLGRRQQQPLVAILDRHLQFAAEFELTVVHEPPLELRQFSPVVQLQAHPQYACGYAAEHREQPMRRDSPHRFLVIDVEFEFLGFRLLAAFDLGADLAVGHRLPDHPGTGLGVFGPVLGDDIERALQRGFDIRHIFGWVDVSLQRRLFRLPEFLLSQQQVSQWLQAPLTRDRRPRPPLGLVRQIDRLERSQVVALLDPRSQRIREQPLFVDRLQDGRFSRGQGGAAFHRIFNRPQRNLVESLSRFLPIPGNKGNRIAGLEQFDRRDNLPEW